MQGPAWVGLGGDRECLADPDSRVLLLGAPDQVLHFLHCALPPVLTEKEMDTPPGASPLEGCYSMHTIFPVSGKCNFLIKTHIPQGPPHTMACGGNE